MDTEVERNDLDDQRAHLYPCPLSVGFGVTEGRDINSIHTLIYGVYYH